MRGIALIGMPTAGKTTVGRLLAESLGWPLYDIDSMMEKSEGKKIAEVIKLKGKRYIAGLEAKTICGLKLEDAVLSTPGSIVYSEGCHEYIKKSTTVIWLTVPLSIIEERLAYDPNNERGVIGLKGGGLENLFNERRPGYEKLADIKLDVEGKDAKMVANEILAMI